MKRVVNERNAGDILLCDFKRYTLKTVAPKTT